MKFCQLERYIYTSLSCPAWVFMLGVLMQVIREKGLQKLPGRRLQDDVDEEEGDLIWTIHEHVPEELKGLVYKVIVNTRVCQQIVL